MAACGDVRARVYVQAAAGGADERGAERRRDGEQKQRAHRDFFNPTHPRARRRGKMDLDAARPLFPMLWPCSPSLLASG